MRTTQGVGKNGLMTTWFCKHLGDAMMADEPVEQLREACRSLLTEGGKPTDMAVFTRHESDGRLHCDVVAYFSPAAAELARAFDADPCEKPARGGLSLLAGDQQCWPVLFPDGP